MVEGEEGRLWRHFWLRRALRDGRRAWSGQDVYQTVPVSEKLPGTRLDGLWSQVAVPPTLAQVVGLWGCL